MSMTSSINRFPLIVIGRISAYLPMTVQTTFENLGAELAGRIEWYRLAV